MNDNNKRPSPQKTDRGEIKDLREALPEYVLKLGLSPDFVGGEIVLLCPFHNDHNPSLRIFGDKLEKWHCFPCDCGGDIFDLSIKLRRSTDFKSALADVKAVLGKDASNIVAMPPRAPATPKAPAKRKEDGVLKAGEAQKIIDSKRALNKAEVSNNPILDRINSDLGFEAILFRSLRDSNSTDSLGLYDGRLAYAYGTGLKVRKFRDEGGPRFYWAFGKALAPWRADLITEEVRKVVIVEGESDCMVAVISGVEKNGDTVAVASPGTSFSKDWVSIFSGKEVVICFDLDDPGQKASVRVAEMLYGASVSVSVVKKEWQQGESKDLREIYLVGGGAAAVIEHIGSAQPWIPSEAAQQQQKAQQLKRPEQVSHDDLPVVLLPCDGRTLGEFCHELGGHMAGRNVFCRSSMPFASLPSKEKCGNELKLITPHMFRSLADELVVTVKVRNTKDGPQEIRRSMSLDVAQAVVQSHQYLAALPILDYIRPARMPIIRRGGALEMLPVGYDPESRTLTHEEVVYDMNMELSVAKALLDEVLSEFQFADDRSRAAAIAAMFTGYCGHLMPADSFTPCFLFDANSQGSGKTTLAQIAALPFGTVAVQPAPKHEDEWRKRLLAMTIAGRGVTILDNVDHHIDSSSLSMYITSYTYSDRILGVSQEFEGKSSTLIFMTGNKMTYSRDLARRVIVIDLFSEELRAEERQYKRRINQKTLKKFRKLLLSAMWCLVKDWDRAGRPKCSTSNSSFPDWCDVVGGIVEHSGFGDPVIRAHREDSGDIDTSNLEALAKVMNPDASCTFKEIVDLCSKHGLFERYVDDTDELGNLSRQAKSGFGKALKAFDQRLVKGLGYFRISGRGHLRRYAVHTIAKDDADQT